METIDTWTTTAIKQLLDSKPTADVLGDALKQANRDGFWLEFGVASGSSLRNIVRHAEATQPRPIVAGFDSFDGLPEDWIGDLTKGSFHQETIPDVPGAEIVVGLFDQTLDRWISTRLKRSSKQVVSLLHIDCDLYQGAKYALSNLVTYLVPGSIIVFDELFAYDGFEKHEWKALYECGIEENLFNFRWNSYLRHNNGYGWSASVVIM